jgi:hypothetical protein
MAAVEVVQPDMLSAFAEFRSNTLILALGMYLVAIIKRETV